MPSYRYVGSPTGGIESGSTISVGSQEHFNTVTAGTNPSDWVLVEQPTTQTGQTTTAQAGDPFEGRKRYVDPFDPQANQVPLLVRGQGATPIPVFDLDQARQMVAQGFTIQGWRLADVSEGVAFASDPAQRRAYLAQNQPSIPGTTGTGSGAGTDGTGGLGTSGGGSGTIPAQGFGPTGFPSPGLASAEATGLVGKGAAQLPTTVGPEGKTALPFLSRQQWAKLLPSEQQIYLSEVENRGFPIQDFLSQFERQTGSAGFAGKPGAQSFGGGGRLALQAQSFR